MRGLKPKMLSSDMTDPVSRIFYRCVDWNMQGESKGSSIASRIFYRCVDWNVDLLSEDEKKIVASFTDAWIETLQDEKLGWIPGRIFYRCVDWNYLKELAAIQAFVASFTDAWIETSNEYRSLEKKVCRIFYRCVDWNR